MLRRPGLQVALAIFLVAALSFSGLLAQQAWSESQALGQLAAAKHRVVAALGNARSIGLYQSEIAPFQERVRRIDSNAPPGTSPFWRTSATEFYQSQAAAYDRVRSSLLAEEIRVTHAARTEAAADLASLRTKLSGATRLGMSPAAAQSDYQKQDSQFGAAASSLSKPAPYRSVSSSLGPITAALTSQIKARQASLTSIVAAGNDTVAGVQRQAAASAAAADQDLDLLGLLSPRASAYRTQVAGMLAAVGAQSDPLQAAVRAAALHDEAAVIHSDFLKTLPAKMVVVSTENQSAQAYQNGRVIYTTPVTTGGPELPTDHGVFHIYEKITPFVFHSPWPPSSPYYYPPTPIQYWMPFDGGEGLHDASWRSNFGPGSNLEPTDLGTGRTILGTHGCVNLPFAAATFVWNWAPLGTTVVVI